jgi:hypothetical protein
MQMGNFEKKFSVHSTHDILKKMRKCAELKDSIAQNENKKHQD